MASKLENLESTPMFLSANNTAFSMVVSETC